MAVSKQYDEQVIILCRMLFEPRKGFQFRAPMLGMPHFYGKTKAQDWPLEPITLVDDIPFLIVGAYALAGHAEEAGSYLEYCVRNATWRDKHYRPATKRQIQAAFEKLLQSPVWKRPLDWRDRDLLERQMK